jgi:hypothetical protein
VEDALSLEREDEIVYVVEEGLPDYAAGSVLLGGSEEAGEVGRRELTLRRAQRDEKEDIFLMRLEQCWLLA